MLKIIAVSKIKETFWQTAEKEYLKRLSAFDKIEIVEIKPSSKKQSAEAVNEEGEKILEKIKKDDLVVSLDVLGGELSSKGLAEKLESWRQKGRITFVIGGPWGLSAEVIKKSEETLSLSKMTFAHQMARIILLEQVYRSFSILSGKSYHK